MDEKYEVDVGDERRVLEALALLMRATEDRWRDKGWLLQSRDLEKIRLRLDRLHSALGVFPYNEVE